jgi:hypothetical protein
MSKNNPQFPLYIPSKGRSEYMMTSKTLTAMGIRHNIVVEPQELDAYRKAVRELKLLTTVIPLDMSYKTKYELCDNFGLTKSTGSGPARNFIWDHSIEAGYPWHWIMDDNIRDFYRLHRNLKSRCYSGGAFKAMEDFLLRYKNISMGGPNYELFVPRKSKHPPFVLNTKIYSCNLIRNDLPFRWRGRYNEDVILSLDMLKAGWCTVQFNAFLQDKVATQTMKGGNTTELYHAEGTVKKGSNYSDKGTIAKSQMLVNEHPDVAKVVWKFGRVHHHVDYSGFKNQKLIRKDNLSIETTPNEYGMVFKDTRGSQTPKNP